MSGGSTTLNHMIVTAILFYILQVQVCQVETVVPQLTPRDSIILLPYQNSVQHGTLFFLSEKDTDKQCTNVRLILSKR